MSIHATPAIGRCEYVYEYGMGRLPGETTEQCRAQAVARFMGQVGLLPIDVRYCHDHAHEMMPGEYRTLCAAMSQDGPKDRED